MSRDIRKSFILMTKTKRWVSKTKLLLKEHIFFEKEIRICSFDELKLNLIFVWFMTTCLTKSEKDKFFVDMIFFVSELLFFDLINKRSEYRQKNIKHV